jgi:hypothetical protein
VKTFNPAPRRRGERRRDENGRQPAVAAVRAVFVGFNAAIMAARLISSRRCGVRGSLEQHQSAATSQAERELAMPIVGPVNES